MSCWAILRLNRVGRLVDMAYPQVRCCGYESHIEHLAGHSVRMQAVRADLVRQSMKTPAEHREAGVKMVGSLTRNTDACLKWQNDVFENAAGAGHGARCSIVGAEPGAMEAFGGVAKSSTDGLWGTNSIRQESHSSCSGSRRPHRWTGDAALRAGP